MHLSTAENILQNTLRYIHLILLLFLTLTSQQSYASQKTRCIPVRASIEAYFVSANCTSPVGLCTAGHITGNALLRGKTQFTAFGIASAAGMTGIEPDTTLSYNGQLIITTKHGILTISDVGIFEQAVSVFTEVDRITTGTGIFKNASGTLFVSGDAFPDGSGFSGTVYGDMCLASMKEDRQKSEW